MGCSGIEKDKEGAGAHRGRRRWISPALRCDSEDDPSPGEYLSVIFCCGCVGACHDSGGPPAHPLEVIGEGWRADLGMANLPGLFVVPHGCFHDGYCPARLDVAGC